MPSLLRRLLPLGLSVILLAGCGGNPAGSLPRASDPATGRGLDPPPTGRVDSPPPAGGVDSPASGGTGGAATGTVPGACSLITRRDVADATSGIAQLRFPYTPTEEPPHDESGAYRGITSVCHLRMQTVFENGATAYDGEVDLRIQSNGAGAFFPPRASVGDTPVGGLGDEAMSRYGLLYVRLGPGMLTFEVHMTIYPTADRTATMAANLDVAMRLAPTVVGRI